MRIDGGGKLLKQRLELLLCFRVISGHELKASAAGGHHQVLQLGIQVLGTERHPQARQTDSYEDLGSGGCVLREHSEFAQRIFEVSVHGKQQELVVTKNIFVLRVIPCTKG